MPIKLNSRYDIFMQDGALAVNDAKEVISQAILTRLGMFLGEYKVDITQGTPWFEIVFRKPFNLAEAESAIKSRIIQTFGVEELTAFKLAFDRTTRKLTISFIVKTNQGDTLEVEGLEVPNV